jgi:hypothetical protein
MDSKEDLLAIVCQEQYCNCKRSRSRPFSRPSTSRYIGRTFSHVSDSGHEEYVITFHILFCDPSSRSFLHSQRTSRKSCDLILLTVITNRQQRRERGIRWYSKTGHYKQKNMDRLSVKTWQLREPHKVLYIPTKSRRSDQWKKRTRRS